MILVLAIEKITKSQNHKINNMSNQRKMWMWLTAIYFVVTAWGHLAFSIWLVSERQGPWGPYAFKQAVPYVAFLGAMLLLVHLWRVYRQSEPTQRRQMVWFWAAWAACVYAVDAWLTFTVNEYAHYPQYALLAWMMAKAWDPDGDQGMVGWIVLSATALGMVDEVAQYVWITRSYSNYLDFNDFLVNLLAVTAGVQLRGMGSVPTAAKRPFYAGWWVLGGLGLLVSLALTTGRVSTMPPSDIKVPPGGLVCHAPSDCVLYVQRGPEFFSSWQPGPHRGRHWVLSPLWGTAVMLMTGALLVTLLRRKCTDGRMKTP
jgi:hypothetical protein